MPFVNALGHKRSQAGTSPSSHKRSKPRFPKTPALKDVLYDGHTSNSLESASTTWSKASVKSQILKRVSTVKTILGLSHVHSLSTPQNHSEPALTLSQSFPTTYLVENDSEATTVHRPLKLRLARMADIPENHTSNAVTSTDPTNDRKIEAGFPNDKPFHRTLRRSQSLPGLQQRISQRLQQAFGTPNTTVVIRSELRSRPSLKTFTRELNRVNSMQLSSSPSTLHSGSGSPRHRFVSTPPTSEPVSTSSISCPEATTLLDLDRQPHSSEYRLLTPIPEADTLPACSILTVENAAAARSFFEIHFNSVLNETTPREVRRWNLHRSLGELQLPLETQHQAYKAWLHAESDNLRQARLLKNTENCGKAMQGVTVRGFEIVKVLGKGSFGAVRLVKAKEMTTSSVSELSQTNEKLSPRKSSQSNFVSATQALQGPMVKNWRTLSTPTTQVFAMKVIRKSDMIRNSQEGHLRAERDLLVGAVGSQWIIQLVAAFQDRNNLYLVMEYCIGGDFLGLLIRRNTLPENETRFYIAEMILCLEEAHRMCWIHRDVKPDNFLIAADGHLKISDFGLAFDGEWWHDQRFHHEPRHTLMDKLGLTLEGDDQDRRERRATEPRRHAERAYNALDRNTSYPHSVLRNQPEGDEPILDWRNRSQRRRLARSVVGTSQYMAPEVVRGEMYDGRCD
ncbi:AGC/NDR/NDR protein kinase [Exophiala aquamarina CBS 119918]|uniref:non-specific serine/threonine protein kinase n=1 Tax=Exophiala aquamarina CBS 119918 TaxID=1182545 RepID=A0A072P2R9_9EURO|nr:AGC/NDR/NDR protein kinase [Exophiala aquamarina CBS 119918]KEF54394.1 AGC/NDR/NDR protein kinase [Exophiala aquamarina CBS 119918]